MATARRSEDRERVALVVGGTGLAACEILPQLMASGEWSDVIMLTSTSISQDMFRTDRKFTVLTGVSLGDKETIIQGLRGVNKQVTHVFWFLQANKIVAIPYLVPLLRGMLNLMMSVYVIAVVHFFLKLMPHPLLQTIYKTQATYAGSGPCDKNEQWIKNLLAALKELNHPVEHFCLGTGGKHYGLHLGPLMFPGYSIPYEEDKDRSAGPLSYFQQEKVVKHGAQNMAFSYSVVRPAFIIGVCPRLSKTTQSMGLVLAVYATVIKINGLPLTFPGSTITWNSLTQLSSSKDIAKVAIWSSTNPRCRNESFNVPSSRCFAWSDGSWKDFADFFGMKSDGPSHPIAGFSCTDIIKSEGEKIWQRLKDSNLVRQDLTFRNLFNPEFFDKCFTNCWDAAYSDKKLLAFDQDLHPGAAMDVLGTVFEEMIDEKIIPNPTDLEKFIEDGGTHSTDTDFPDYDDQPKLRRIHAF